MKVYFVQTILNFLLAFFLLELCLDGTIRTVGGPSELIGRVEVCVNTTWGTICGDNWSDTNALVFCRQLGHSPYGIISEKIISSLLNIFYINWVGAIAGKGGFPVSDQRMSHMENVSCTGSEKSLLQCSYSTVSSPCSPDNVAGIICQGMEVHYAC